MLYKNKYNLITSDNCKRNKSGQLSRKFKKKINTNHFVP